MSELIALLYLVPLLYLSTLLALSPSIKVTDVKLHQLFLIYAPGINLVTTLVSIGYHLYKPFTRLSHF